ncbi:MAG TPA: hypothetical protein DCY20_06565 [Firmicutes bacterium]|nr:hypothetical protein [Bacillota bacterium]
MPRPAVALPVSFWGKMKNIFMIINRIKAVSRLRRITTLGLNQGFCLVVLLLMGCSFRDIKFWEV